MTTDARTRAIRYHRTLKVEALVATIDAHLGRLDTAEENDRLADHLSGWPVAAREELGLAARLKSPPSADTWAEVVEAIRKRADPRYPRPRVVLLPALTKESA